jgi:hypothetical protein
MILYACIVRADTLLVHAGDITEASTNATVRHLLARPPNLGWDFLVASQHARRKGVKFHIYAPRDGDDTVSDDDEQATVWSYACVYDPKRGKKKTAQAFLVKLLLATEMARLTDPDWGYGDMLACQESFGPTLGHHMGEASYLPQSVLLTTSMLIAHDYTARNRQAVSVRQHSQGEEEGIYAPGTIMEEKKSRDDDVVGRVTATYSNRPSTQPLTPQAGSIKVRSAVILPTPPSQPHFAVIELKKSRSLESVESTFTGDDDDDDDLLFSPTNSAHRPEDDNVLSPRSIVEERHAAAATRETPSPPKAMIQNVVLARPLSFAPANSFSDASGIFTVPEAPVAETAPWCRPWRQSTAKAGSSVEDAGPCFFLTAWFQPRPSLFV